VNKHAFSGLLAIVGTLALGLLIREVGVGQLLAALAAGASVVPLLVLLEIAGMALDALAIRALHGARGREIEVRTWVRSTLVATFAAQTLPGGRVLGEVLRASLIAPRLAEGASTPAVRAASVALVGHGLHVLVASGMASACAVMLDGPLRWALAAVAAWTLALGTTLTCAPRSLPALRWIARRLQLTQLADVSSVEPIDGLPRALGFSVLARLVHLTSAGVAVHAVLTASSPPMGALVSESLQLLAANVGDAVPGQAGVIEGTFRVFSDALYPSASPTSAASAAVAVALLLRATRIGVAATAGVAYWLAPARSLRTALAIGALLVPSGAAAQPTLIAHQRLVALVNPFGAEHGFALGVRWERGDGVDPLREGTHLELGGVTYVSPLSQLSGAYLQFVPWAFLVLRAELMSLTQWPIGLDGAGYYAIPEYAAQASDQLLGPMPADEGAVAAGFDLQLSATLQLAARFGIWRPILLAQVTFEHETLGDAPFHYDPRYDLVLARQDWMVASSSYAMIELAASSQVAIRIGAYDDLRFVPRSGYANHVLGPVAMLSLTELDAAVPEVLILVRAGAHLDDSRREGEWTGLLGLLVTYDLGAAP
jgi:hypothetical protein